MAKGVCGVKVRLRPCVQQTAAGSATSGGGAGVPWMRRRQAAYPDLLETSTLDHTDAGTHSMEVETSGQFSFP